MQQGRRTSGSCKQPVTCVMQHPGPHGRAAAGDTLEASSLSRIHRHACTHTNAPERMHKRDRHPNMCSSSSSPHAAHHASRIPLLARSLAPSPGAPPPPPSPPHYRQVRFFDTAQGRPIGDAFTHNLEIKEVALSQAGTINDRMAIFIDRNRWGLACMDLRAYERAWMHAREFGCTHAHRGPWRVPFPQHAGGPPSCVMQQQRATLQAWLLQSVARRTHVRAQPL